MAAQIELVAAADGEGLGAVVSVGSVSSGGTCHAVAGVLRVGEQDAVGRGVVARRVHGVGAGFVQGRRKADVARLD